MIYTHNIYMWIHVCMYTHTHNIKYCVIPPNNYFTPTSHSSNLQHSANDCFLFHWKDKKHSKNNFHMLWPPHLTSYLHLYPYIFFSLQLLWLPLSIKSLHLVLDPILSSLVLKALAPSTVPLSLLTSSIVSFLFPLVTSISTVTCHVICNCGRQPLRWPTVLTFLECPLLHLTSVVLCEQQNMAEMIVHSLLTNFVSFPLLLCILHLFNKSCDINILSVTLFFPWPLGWLAC